MQQSPSTDGATAGVPTWDEIVERHSDRVYRLAYRLTGNRADAEDLTQEVFVRVFRSLHTYTPGTFEGWLHRITTNVFLDQARRRQRIRFDSLSDERASLLPSQHQAPDAAFLDGTFDDDVEQALASLSPEFRAAVVLCDVEGLSYEEIAEILDAKLGTVRSRIHRGRTQLRRALAHREPGAGRERYAGPHPVDERLAPAVEGGPPMIGHLGPRVSALLDGQLDAVEEERAWEHVHACHQCRDDVEREGWVKTRLAEFGQLPTRGPGTAPSGLKGSLLLAPSLVTAGLTSGLTPGDSYLVAHRRPRAASVAVGSGAVGMAMLGVLLVGAAPASAPATDRRAPVTSLVGSGSGVTSRPETVDTRTRGQARRPHSVAFARQ